MIPTWLNSNFYTIKTAIENGQMMHVDSYESSQLADAIQQLGGNPRLMEKLSLDQLNHYLWVLSMYKLTGA